MPGRNDIAKGRIIGLRLMAATGAVAIFFLSAPLLFAQTDPQPSSEAKAEKKVEDPKKQKTEDPERKFSTACGIDFDQAARKIFINSSSKGWRQHTEATQPLQLVPDDESAYTVRKDSSGKRYVREMTPGEDFDIYQDDCFRDSGKLEFFHFEFRTIWGWGYEEAQTYDATGKLAEKIFRFFDTRNEKPIDEPAQTKDVADAMKPKVHKTYSSMPFATFFEE